MQRYFRQGGLVAVTLSLSLLLGACSSQQAVQPSASPAARTASSAPASAAQAASSPSASTVQTTASPSSAVQPAASVQATQGNGSTTAATASASPAAQQAGSTTNASFASDQNALSEYETIVNGVYQRTINGVVNLSDGRVTGSGYVIDTQGHIITNNHVAGEMQNIIVTFADQSTATGRLVGTFAQGDIAVVKVDQLPANVKPVELGDSSQLKIGQITIAIGSPLGLQQTVTSGIVSALNRSTEDLGDNDPNTTLQGLIQTDAAINPGNSGGPLFNAHGQVIGMNTLIASLNQGNVGLGFAIPINRIKRVANQIIQTGRYTPPRMGVSIRSIPPQIAQQYNLPTNGVMIAQTDPADGPAAKAGLKGATRVVQVRDQTGNGSVQIPIDGDIIVAIDGKPVRTVGDLQNILQTDHNAGDTITVTFVRGGQQQQTKVTLGS